MKHRKKTLGTLLKSTHAHRDTPPLPAGWRASVMADIAREGSHAAPISELERMAPSFAFAAVAVSVLMLVTASLVFESLPSTLFAAYATQALDVTATPWTSL